MVGMNKLLDYFTTKRKSIEICKKYEEIRRNMKKYEEI